MANNPEIKIIITGDSSKATQSIKALEKELKKIENIKVSSNLGSSFTKIEESTNKIKSASKVIDDLKNNFDQLGISLKSAAAAYVGFQAISTIVSKGVQTFTSFLKAGFNAVNEFELTITSLAATMATFNKESTPENIVEQYKEFKKKAEDIIPVLDQLASKTLLSGDNVRTMVLEFAKGGQVIESTNKRQIAALENISNALGVVLGSQVSEKQILQEIGDLWQGQITAASSLGQILKGVIGNNIKEQLKIWKDQGILIEKVGESLKAFGAASEDLKDSWTAVKSTIQTTLTTLLREDFAPINEIIIARVKEFNTLLKENPDVIVNIINNLKDMASLLSSISSIITFIVQVMDKLKVVTEFTLRLFRKLFEESDKSFKSIQDSTRMLRETKEIKLFNNQNTLESVEGIKRISTLTEKNISDVKVLTGETLRYKNIVKEAGIEHKEIKKSLNDQINDLSSLGVETQKLVDKVGQLSGSQKKVKKEIQGLIDDYTQLNEIAKFDEATEGLDIHKKAIREIQDEIEVVTEKYGVIPQLIDQATDAIQREIAASETLNSKLARTADLQAQQTIADLSKNSFEKVGAETSLKDKKIQDATDVLNKQLQSGADSVLAERAFALQKEKIINDFNEKVKSIESSKWDFLDELQKRGNASANEDVAAPFERMEDSLRESVSLSDRLAANMERTSNSANKAKQFGQALSLDSVSSLALERNLRFAGRGGMPSRSLDSLALSGEGVRSIVPESFQQESRMIAIQDILSRAATGQDTGFSGEQIEGLRDELQEKFGINFRGQGGTDNSINTNNVYNISTPDSQSFRASQKQITEEANRQSEQVARRKRRSVVSGSNR